MRWDRLTAGTESSPGLQSEQHRPRSSTPSRWTLQTPLAPSRALSVTLKLTPRCSVLRPRFGRLPERSRRSQNCGSVVGTVAANYLLASVPTGGSRSGDIGTSARREVGPEARNLVGEVGPQVASPQSFGQGRRGLGFGRRRAGGLCHAVVRPRQHRQRHGQLRPARWHPVHDRLDHSERLQRVGDRFCDVGHRRSRHAEQHDLQHRRLARGALFLDHADADRARHGLGHHHHHHLESVVRRFLPDRLRELQPRPAQLWRSQPDHRRPHLLVRRW